MRKNILYISVSLIITALFIGLAVMPVTARDALSIDAREPVINEVEEETFDATEGEVAMPAQTQPPTEVCPNCVTAILKSAVATIQSRVQAIEEFVDIMLSMPDMTLTQFNDALIDWFLNTRVPIIIELGDYLFNVYDFSFDIESAVNIAYEALEDLALDLYNAHTNPEHPAYPLEYPALTTIVTVAEIMFLFVIITSGALLIQCLAGLFNGEQSASAPAATTETTILAGTTGSASL